MDLNKDLTEGEFRVLIIEKLDNILEKQDLTKERLDSHSSQLKALWISGGISSIVAGWLGLKGGSQ